MSGPPLVAGYSTRDVARLLGIAEGRVRALARSGLVSPRRGRRRELRFSFQDLVVLRSAQGLLDAGLPPRRVREALARLGEQLPGGRSLASVRIGADRGSVVVRGEGEFWEPESGQRLLDFEVADLAARVAPLARRNAERARRLEGMGAEDWYGLAWELEAAATEEAAEAYRRALEIDPEHFDARVNLGRLLHEGGELEAAEACFRRAAEVRPDDPTGWFNLGVALQDRGRREEAIGAYRRSVEADPQYADAYFNLAGLYEELGQRAVAIKNLKAYRRLVRG